MGEDLGARVMQHFKNAPVTTECPGDAALQLEVPWSQPAAPGWWGRAAARGLARCRGRCGGQGQ